MLSKSGAASYLQWLPNAITSLRPVLALLASIAAVQGKWEVALWLLLGAIATDFLDGLVAKKLHAISEFGQKLDAFSDAFVVMVSILGLGVAGQLSWLLVVLILLGGAAAGSDWVLALPKWRWHTVFAVSYLFVAWIGIAWFYASMAFGWSWLYVVLTVIILAACGIFKRHRIKAWIEHKKATNSS